MSTHTNDEKTALDWWHNKLSLNEQKAFAKEVRGSLWEYTWQIPSAICEVWIGKGRPS